MIGIDIKLAQCKCRHHSRHERAQYKGKGKTSFEVWAPHAKQLSLQLSRSKGIMEIIMQPSQDGVFSAMVDATPGDRYLYRIGNMLVPDPVSRSLPRGVHGPTEIVDPKFPWTDMQWRGLPFLEYIINELHVGTFSPEGTFDWCNCKVALIE